MIVELPNGSFVDFDAVTHTTLEATSVSTPSGRMVDLYFHEV